MIRVVVLLLALLVPWQAMAQGANIYCLTGISSTGAPAWAPASAGQPCPVIAAPKSFTALASTATLTVSGSAQNLPNIPAGALYAVLTVAGGPVVWRDDGGAPTASDPQTLPVNIYQYSGPLAAIQFILATGTGSATVRAAYYK